MKVSFERNIDAEGATDAFRYTVTFSGAERQTAFTNQVDPDEDLYYDLYSDEFKNATTSGQLQSCLKFAQLVESPPATAVASKGATVPKL